MGLAKMSEIWDATQRRSLWSGKNCDIFLQRGTQKLCNRYNVLRFNFILLLLQWILRKWIFVLKEFFDKQFPKFNISEVCFSFSSFNWYQWLPVPLVTMSFWRVGCCDKIESYFKGTFFIACGQQVYIYNQIQSSIFLSNFRSWNNLVSTFCVAVLKTDFILL